MDINTQNTGNTISDRLFQKVLERIAPVLMDEDIEFLNKLNQQGGDASTIKNFLLSKVPNLEKIIAEEAKS